MQRQPEQTGEPQISTSDPQSRQFITRKNITEVAYNVQTVVDAKKNLPIDYKVTNQNDSRALSGMLRRTKTILGTTDFTTVYDKRYNTRSEIKMAVTSGINIMVAIPGIASVAQMQTTIWAILFMTKQMRPTLVLSIKYTTNGNAYQKNKNVNHYTVKTL